MRDPWPCDPRADHDASSTVMRDPKAPPKGPSRNTSVNYNFGGIAADQLHDRSVAE